MPHTLDPDKIIKTVERLRTRISERFPDANLSKVAGNLLEVAERAGPTIRRICRPNVLLRLAILVFISGFVWLVYETVNDFGFSVEVREAGAAAQMIESLLNEVVYVGIAIYFLFSLESRFKRWRALNAIHEIRSLAHIVDMHQLTKDPESVLRASHDTPSSPARILTPYELSRYLDYCSEMLSLMGKIAALYVQGFKDSVVLQAVDDVESLTTGLARKIWQKITLIPMDPKEPAPPALSSPRP